MAILTQILSNLSVSSIMLLWSVYMKHKVFLLNNLKPESFSQISCHFHYYLLCYSVVCLLLRSHFAQETKYKSKFYLLLYKHYSTIKS